MIKLFLATLLISGSVFARNTQVNGYMKKNGIYVNGYNRTSPNDTRNDNYSNQGNTNPYTGQQGLKPYDYGN